MRFHVLGVGAIGSLVSFHIKRTARLVAENVQHLRKLPTQSVVPHWPVPYDVGVALRLHRSSFVRKATEKAHNSIVLERSGTAQREDGFGVQWSGTVDQLGGIFSNAAETSTTAPVSLRQEKLPGLSLCEEMGHPTGTIDSLLVTTKAQNTVTALQPLVPHLSAASTLVLLQTGQGVLDRVVKELFPDPLKRPNIILASTTHSARLLGKLHAAHELAGRLDIAVVPNMHIGQEYERIWTPPANALRKIEDDELRRATDFGEGGVRGVDNAATDEKQSRKDDDLQSLSSLSSDDLISPRQRRRDQKLRKRSAASLDAPLVPELDLAGIPQNDHSLTLVSTMAVLLSLPLNVTWHPIRRFQMLSLRRLVVSACIEPLSALAHCRNGELFGNKDAEDAMRDVCREANQVLKALGERTRKEAQLQREQQQRQQPDDNLTGMSDFMLGPDLLIGDAIFPDAPALDPSLYTGALLDDVHRTIRATGPSYSVMYYDLNFNKPKRSFGGSSEIQYINGYLGRLGRSLGVPTPINDMLTSLCRLRTSKAQSSWTFLNNR